MEIGQRVKYKDGYMAGEGILEMDDVLFVKKQYRFLVNVGEKDGAYYNEKGEAIKKGYCRWFSKVEPIYETYKIY